MPLRDIRTAAHKLKQFSRKTPQNIDFASEKRLLLHIVRHHAVGTIAA
jgi:hypothetical protein